jgi:hypothetical protein
VEQETRRLLAFEAGDKETASWWSKRPGDSQLVKQETRRQPACGVGDQEMLACEAGDKENASWCSRRHGDSQLGEQKTRR